MKLDEIVTWYQKKIGTYDVQQWEKTVEQKILDGFGSGSTSLKTAKLKTELIDVDLVRGSTFPKAKPKQSLLTVIRLAILRYLFLPVYSNWWVKQTSPHAFTLLLLLYISQMINWAVYTFHVHRLTTESTQVVESGRNNGSTNAIHPTNGSDDGVKPIDEHIISISELLIPMTLSLLLSLIHSQIVATNAASSAKTNRKRFSNSGVTSKLSRGELKVRRRKKLVKTRSQDMSDAVTSQQRKPPTALKKVVGTPSTLDSRIKTAAAATAAVAAHAPSTTATAIVTASSNNSPGFYDKETFYTTSTIAAIKSFVTDSTSDLQVDLTSRSASTTAIGLQALSRLSVDFPSDNICANKKRSVNWNSPVHNYAAIETQEKHQQTSPQSVSSATTTTTSETTTPNNQNAVSGDGSSIGSGGISGNGNNRGSSGSSSSSSGSGINNASSSNSNSNSSSGKDSPSKTVRIDDRVQEIGSPGAVERVHEPAVAGERGRRVVGEDDGFESLNGKSSSGEDNHSPLPSGSTTGPPAAAAISRNHLRLRLNAGDYPQSNSIRSADDVGAVYPQTKFPQLKSRLTNASSEETEEDGDDGEIISSPNSLGHASNNYTECTTSATEWLGVTTNSEECSYSSDLDNTDQLKGQPLSDEDICDADYTPTILLNAPGSTDRISCAVWEQHDLKKAQMSVLDISSCIIERVEAMPETYDYIYIGIFFSLLLSFIPCFCRLCEITLDTDKMSEINYLEVPLLLWEKASFSFSTIVSFAFGHTTWVRTFLLVSFVQRFCLTSMLFLIFAVAERTFKQRFLYAKLFSHLTSSRRARKSNLPHFRLNKVRNIKTWLSVRSYLKKRGPQRSVDVIVSAAFLVTLLLLAFLSVEWLKDSVQLHSHLNLEALMWSTTIGIFLLRFMTLGNKIHEKYRSVSVLITEQINLYLQIEQKPKKKDELMVANSVLKLAADLLKELEGPFKISGLSANPYLFTTIKVVILSALSGVLSEMLGFKLKLHKIKIK